MPVPTNSRRAILRWVIPFKLVDVFWGMGWEKQARYRLITTPDQKIQSLFVSGHLVPQHVKADFLQQVEQLHVNRNKRVRPQAPKT